MSTALSIKGKTQANDAVTSTINYVNPNATNAQLQSLASAMNDLTTNTIVDVTRIDKQSLTGAVTKLPRNLQLSESTLIASEISDSAGSPTAIVLTGAGLTTTDLTLKKTDNQTFLYTDWKTGEFDGDISILFVIDQSQTATSSELTFELPETETYQAASVTLTILTS